VKLICNYVSFLGGVVLKRYQDFFIGSVEDVVLTHAPHIRVPAQAHAGGRRRAECAEPADRECEARDGTDAGERRRMWGPVAHTL